MAIVTSYPGAYLSEDLTQNISVQSSPTAIPAFLFLDYTGEASPTVPSVRYTDWPDFLGKIGKDDSNTHYFDSVKFWFMNGGGPCYLINRDNISTEFPKYDDITLLVEAGATFSNDYDNKSKIYQAYLDVQPQCPGIFGLFDGPQIDLAKATSIDDVMQHFPTTPYAAAYYPWLKVDWSVAQLPPSVIAAVTIAKVDRARGVWKSPGNVVIPGFELMFPVNDQLQARFYPGKSMNKIRNVGGAGYMVWGGRTLEDSNNWRYISVRRLFNMVLKDLRNALGKMFLEPNDSNIWARVKAAVNNYLYGLWQQGALVGKSPDEAWFVDVGKDITMTEADINQGKLIVKIGLAPVRPAEFILLEFTQNIRP